MNVDDEVLEKLRKVLTLAQRGATQGEMEAAMAQAKKIAMRHNIDLASVDLDAHNKKNIRITIKGQKVAMKSRYWRKWHPYICWTIQAVFGVRSVYNVYPQGSREILTMFCLIGAEEDLPIAQMVIEWLDEMFPKAFREMVRLGKLPDKAEFARGFYEGLYRGIVEANKREEEKLSGDDRNKYALVVRTKADALAEEMAKLNPKLDDHNYNTNAVARAYGYEKGKNINLNQVGAGDGK